MSEISQKCRAMAAQMLDAELMAIQRKFVEGDELTPLQRAVLSEIERRKLASPYAKSADATNGVYIRGT